MIIRTSRLMLVPLGLDHIDSTCVYSLDRELTKFMIFLPCDDKEEVRRYITKCITEQKKQQPLFYEFAVMLGEQHIGSASLYFEGKDDVFSVGELGWIISKGFCGQGYATEAASGIITEFHSRFSLNQFIAHADSENLASRRVMEKLGMRLVSETAGRFNRVSENESREVLYELII